jgi:lipid-binding SYLF domain-containing protein
MMKAYRSIAISVFLVLIFTGVNTVHADNYTKTIEIFRQSDAVKPFFESAYGYAVFPMIGKAGFVVGGAYGTGKVYANGAVTGTTRLVKASIGFQAGGQAFSQMVFFQDKRAYDEFTSGSFEFDAGVSAVAITAGVQAKAGTGGATAGASAGPSTGTQAPTTYTKGMAVFVHATGGLMYEASIGGQKFSYTPNQ